MDIRSSVDIDTNLEFYIAEFLKRSENFLLKENLIVLKY